MVQRGGMLQSSQPSEHCEHPYLRVAQHDTKGRILVATQPLKAGQTILHEEPVIIVKGGDDAITAYRAFLKQPPEVQAKILSFYSPVDGPQTKHVRAVASRLLSSPAAVDECVKVAAVFHFNSVGVNPPSPDGAAGQSVELGAGLYATACLASHSCQPTCFWFSDPKGWRIIRTLVPLAEGEEITIDYGLEVWDIKPVHERQARLNTWGFQCSCTRCIEDNTRRFPCKVSKCAGYHLMSQPSGADTPTLLPCSTCSTPASAAHTTQCVEKETELISQLARLNEAIDAGKYHPSMFTPISRLKAPHPHHYLAADVGHLQWELYKNVQEFDKSAQAAQAEVACREAIITWPSRKTAFMYEYKGDVLMSKTPSDVLRAQDAYRHALHNLMITDGPEQPFAALEARLLSGVQARMRPQDQQADVGLDVCTFCALPCTASNVFKLGRCGACQKVAYCCVQHQKAHWPVHKKSCPGAKEKQAKKE